MSSPTRPDPAKPLCAEMSRAHAESLHATASRVDTWILIEYRGLWAHDAVDGSTLSGALKAHLVAERVPSAARPHPLRPSLRAAQRRRAPRLLRPLDAERARAPLHRARPSRRSDRARPRDGRHARSTIRSSSSARTASTTAAAPSSAGRSTTRCASRSRTAGCGSRRTSAATASPATSSSSTTASTTGAWSRRTPGPWSRRRSSAASISRSTAAAPLRLCRAGGRDRGARVDLVARPRRRSRAFDRR